VEKIGGRVTEKTGKGRGVAERRERPERSSFLFRGGLRHRHGTTAL